MPRASHHKAGERSKIIRRPVPMVTEPDRDERIVNLEDMISSERRIAANERINIVVEYARLGQEVKPEKYVGRPRYIKGYRGRTRLAKRSARRDDEPPPEEKMIVYDDEAAQLLYGAKYACLRKPGAVIKTEATKEEPMDEDEHGKEHSRDSGCPVSPADKPKEEETDKKEGSSRGSVEKDSRKRRSPEISGEENATSGTSHFIVKGSTPLTVIRKLLERKRQIHDGLRLELIDNYAKHNIEEKWTVADLANQRGWTRNAPLRILYTITRFSEAEEAPVLEAEGAMSEEALESPGVLPRAPASPRMQQLHHLQQQRAHHPQQFHPQQPPFPYAMVISDDGTRHMIMHPPLMQDCEDLARMSVPSSSSHHISPPHHHQQQQQQHHQQQQQQHHFLAPPNYMAMAPPHSHHHQHQQPSTSSSSIFPPEHVIVERGNASHIVAANMSVESAISNPASVKKRARMAPKRMRDRDELMARNGIEKGTTFAERGGKLAQLPVGLGISNLPGVVSIRMPAGCTPQILQGDNKAIENLPIEATTIDGKTHKTTWGELPRIAQEVSARMNGSTALAHAHATAPPAHTPVAPLPSSMLTPEERVLETIDTVRTKAAVMHERIQAERRASDASSTASAAAAVVADADEEAAPPQLAPEAPSEETPEEVEAPPVLDAPETPDSPRSLEIDEMMDQVTPPPPPPPTSTLQRIPA